VRPPRQVPANRRRGNSRDAEPCMDSINYELTAECLNFDTCLIDDVFSGKEGKPCCKQLLSILVDFPSSDFKNFTHTYFHSFLIAPIMDVYNQPAATSIFHDSDSPR
jgi:hypothetical protein